MDQGKGRAAFRVVAGGAEQAGRADPSAVGPSSPPVAPPADRRAARGLAGALARIREDSRLEPGAYLEQTEVPGGGE